MREFCGNSKELCRNKNQGRCKITDYQQFTKTRLFAKFYPHIPRFSRTPPLRRGAAQAGGVSPPLPPFKGVRGIKGWPQAREVISLSSKERAGVRSTFPSFRLTPLLTNHTGAAVICEMSYADKFAIMLVKTILDAVKQVRLPELKVPANNV